MPDPGSRSPDDPAWVDDIVKRALERAGEVEVEVVPPPAKEPAATVEPVATEAPQSVAAEPEAPVHPKPVDDAVIDELFAPEPAAVAVGTATAGEMIAPPTESGPIETETPQYAPASAEHARGERPYPDAQHGMQREPDGHRDQLGEESASNRMRGFLEWGAVIVGALAVALVIKTFLMQAYFIPSESMVPALNVGDRVLVNKLSYEFGEVGRGDLIVFHRPPTQVSGEDDLIKRVIALSGETIEIRDSTIFITTADSDTQLQLTEPYLVEGMIITGLVDTSNCVNPTPTSCEIPENHVFVMGDNRDRSRDGRSFGPISEDLIVGRAFLRVWPLSDISFL